MLTDVLRWKLWGQAGGSMVGLCRTDTHLCNRLLRESLSLLQMYEMRSIEVKQMGFGALQMCR